MQNILIIISGKATSGKSEAAKILKEYSNKEIKVFSFATKLKQIAEELFNWDGDKNIYYEKNEPIRNKGRQLLINVGQQMRWIQWDVWTQYLKKQIEQWFENSSNKIAIIDDCRFLDEITTMKKINNSYSIRIIRNVKTIDDISEKNLDSYNDYDYIIYNYGTIDDLKEKIINIYNQILEKTND